jgi:hypothetical protein
VVATRSEPAKGTGLKQTEGMIGQLRLSASSGEPPDQRSCAYYRREEMIGLSPAS